MFLELAKSMSWSRHNLATARLTNRTVLLLILQTSISIRKRGHEIKITPTKSHGNQTRNVTKITIFSFQSEEIA